MIVKDNVRYTPYMEYCKPLECRADNIIRAGWKHETKTGALLAFDGTYNDRVESLTVNGRTTQVQTVQSRNLYNKSKFVPSAYRTLLNDNGTNAIRFLDTSGSADYNFLGNGIAFKPNTQYTVTLYARREAETGSCACAIQYTDGTYTQLLSGLTTAYKKITITSSAGKTISKIGYTGWYGTYGYIQTDTLQIEEGTAATAYTPFVPNSPSPDYTSPITGVQPTRIMVNGNDCPLTLPALYSLPDGTRDRVDIISGAGTQNIAAFQINGVVEGEVFYSSFGWNSETSPTVCYAGIIPNLSTARATTNILCDSLTVKGISAETGNNEGIYKVGNNYLYIFISKSRFGYVFGDSRETVTAKIKAYLAAHPMNFIYKLETPQPFTVTPMTIPTIPLHTELSADGAEITATAKTVDTTL